MRKGEQIVGGPGFTPHRRLRIRPKLENLTRVEELVAFLSPMSDKEISSVLGTSEGTIKVYVHRIRKKLRSRLGLLSRVDLANYCRDGCLGEEFTLP